MAIGGGASGKSITQSTPSSCSLVALCAPPSPPPRCAHHRRPAPPHAPTSRSRRRGPSNHVFLLDHFSPMYVLLTLNPLTPPPACSGRFRLLPPPPIAVQHHHNLLLSPFVLIPLCSHAGPHSYCPPKEQSSQRREQEKEDVRVMRPHRRSPEVGGAHDMICQVGFQVRLACSVSFC
jgi:hypothetical protein